MDDIQASSSFTTNVNVRIQQFNNDTGKLMRTFEGHNRVTKMALMGIARFCNGEFNETTPQLINQYIPSYVALGTNRASAINYGVTTEVTVDDSKLLSEIPPRLPLASSNIENRQNNAFIRLTMKAYVPVDMFVNETIGEAGLFSQPTGNNCWARIVIPEPIEKGTNTVLDITWEVNIVSVSNTGSDGAQETATADKILEGYTATIRRTLTDGTMTNHGTVIVNPDTSPQSLESGYYDSITITGDPNLLAKNIKRGVTIFGIEGTYEG